MAVKIIVNAKVQRPGVCNAAETLLVHREVAARFLPMTRIADALQEPGASNSGATSATRRSSPAIIRPPRPPTGTPNIST